MDVDVQSILSSLDRLTRKQIVNLISDYKIKCSSHNHEHPMEELFQAIIGRPVALLGRKKWTLVSYFPEIKFYDLPSNLALFCEEWCRKPSQVDFFEINSLGMPISYSQYIKAKEELLQKVLRKMSEEGTEPDSVLLDKVRSAKKIFLQPD